MRAQAAMASRCPIRSWRERAALKALRGDYHELSRGTLGGTQRYDFAYEAAGR